MLRRRRSDPPADDRRGTLRYFDATGDDERSDGDDNRRPSRRPVEDDAYEVQRAARRPAPVYDDDGREDHLPLIEWCSYHADLLMNDWQRNFLIGASGFRRLSPAQWKQLDLIADKISLGLRVLRYRRPR
jgi:hypothetical protein